MPIVRYRVRNEFALADPALYGAAAGDDPESLLDGVAAAGLVGVLRQLGDLAEFASEIFNNLHEGVMATATRGQGLVLRVRQVESEFSEIEKAFLYQNKNSNINCNSGVNWHPDLQLGQSLMLQTDMPRFILNSLDQCRGAPRLCLLDKFDIAEGACLKRYSDPSVFRVNFASSGIREPWNPVEKKPRETKVLAQRRCEHPESLLEPDGQSKSTNASSQKAVRKHVKLKKRHSHYLNTGLKRCYIECVLVRHLTDSNICYEDSADGSAVDTESTYSCEADDEVDFDNESNSVVFEHAAFEGAERLQFQINGSESPLAESEENRNFYGNSSDESLQSPFQESELYEPFNDDDSKADGSSISYLSESDYEDNMPNMNLKTETNGEDITKTKFGSGKQFDANVEQYNLHSQTSISDCSYHGEALDSDENTKHTNTDLQYDQGESNLPSGAENLIAPPGEQIMQSQFMYEMCSGRNVPLKSSDHHESLATNNIPQAEPSHIPSVDTGTVYPLVTSGQPNIIEPDASASNPSICKQLEVKRCPPTHRKKCSVRFSLDNSDASSLPLQNVVGQISNDSPGLFSEQQGDGSVCDPSHPVQDVSQDQPLGFPNSEKVQFSSTSVGVITSGIGRSSSKENENVQSCASSKVEGVAPNSTEYEKHLNAQEVGKKGCLPLHDQLPPAPTTKPPTLTLDEKSSQIANGNSHVASNGDGDIGFTPTQNSTLPPKPPVMPDPPNQSGKPNSHVNHPRDALIESLSAHDKSMMRKVVQNPAIPKVEGMDALMAEIRNKSFNLKPAAASRPNIKGPAINLKLAAILDKVNKMRVAYAGDEEDDFG